VRPDVARRHVRVRVDPRPADEPRALHHARAVHAFAHRLTRLAAIFDRQGLVLDGRDLQMDVDPGG